MTLTLTTDELRVAAALAGGRLPVALDGGWSTEDVPVADTVALRGLLARGLAVAEELTVSLTDTAAVVTALLEPRTLIEVRRDGAAHAGRWLVTELAACTEARPDLWSFTTFDIDLLITELLAGVAGDTSNANPVLVPTNQLAEADRRITQGDVADVRPDVAGVLVDTRVTTTVRRADRDGALTGAAAVTWLETTESGAWLAVPVDLEEKVVPHTELRPVGCDDLRALVLDVIKGNA